MPYRLDPDNPRCVQKRPYSGDASWETMKCHPSTDMAQKHLAALKINVEKAEQAASALIEADLPPDAVPPTSIAKLDEDENLVFGWFNVSVTKDGRELIDLHGHEIEPKDLEQAAYDFVLESREGGEMHQGVTKAQLVESVFITPDKLESWGLPSDAITPRWWGGFKVDPEVFAKVKDGTYQMFSVQGKAHLEEA